MCQEEKCLALIGQDTCKTFLSESWKGRFKTLSDTIGFNLRIYSEDGNPIFLLRSVQCAGVCSLRLILGLNAIPSAYNTMMEAFY